VPRPLPQFAEELLACPLCAAEVHRAPGALACASGHSFDTAREGYVNLTTGRTRHTGDTAEMLTHRSAVHASGAFQPLVDEIAGTVARHATSAGTLLEIGAGDAYYVGELLTSNPGARAVALDASKHAARRAAAADARIVAVVADAWDAWPLRSDAIDVVLTAFAPRNPEQTARVLAPEGIAVVAAAGPDHLAELRGPLGLLSVQPDKDTRIEERYAAAGLERIDSRELVWRQILQTGTVRDVALMGPSAFHTQPDALDSALEALPAPVAVTFHVQVATFAPIRS